MVKEFVGDMSGTTVWTIVGCRARVQGQDKHLLDRTEPWLGGWELRLFRRVGVWLSRAFENPTERSFARRVRWAASQDEKRVFMRHIEENFLWYKDLLTHRRKFLAALLRGTAFQALHLRRFPTLGIWTKRAAAASS